jgi:hypothetical protein
MTDKADHIAWAAEAVAVFQRHCKTADEHAIADLICDLGHLADERGFDFLSEVRRGIGHWYAEQHAMTATTSGRTPLSNLHYAKVTVAADTKALTCKVGRSGYDN